jgi:hypothetical protein
LETTIIAQFDTRRAAELAVEHVVQEYGIQRSDVFVQPAGSANTAGVRSAGADKKAAPKPEQGEKLEGLLEVSVDFHGEDPRRLVEALESAGAETVRTK